MAKFFMSIPLTMLNDVCDLDLDREKGVIVSRSRNFIWRHGVSFVPTNWWASCNVFRRNASVSRYWDRLCQCSFIRHKMSSSNTSKTVWPRITKLHRASIPTLSTALSGPEYDLKLPASSDFSTTSWDVECSHFESMRKTERIEVRAGQEQMGHHRTLRDAL